MLPAGQIKLPGVRSSGATLNSSSSSGCDPSSSAIGKPSSNSSAAKCNGKTVLDDRSSTTNAGSNGKEHTPQNISSSNVADHLDNNNTGRHSELRNSSSSTSRPINSSTSGSSTRASNTMQVVQHHQVWQLLLSWREELDVLVCDHWRNGTFFLLVDSDEAPDGQLVAVTLGDEKQREQQGKQEQDWEEKQQEGQHNAAARNMVREGIGRHAWFWLAVHESLVIDVTLLIDGILIILLCGFK